MTARLLLMLLLATLVGCAGPVPDGQVGQSCEDASRGEQPWFEDEVLPIFEAYCTLCHAAELEVGAGPGTRRGATPDVDYDSWEGAGRYPELTWERMADRTMPPMGAVPTTAELETLLEFLSCREIAEGDDDDDDSAR
jgi:hypothetical protein